MKKNSIIITWLMAFLLFPAAAFAADDNWVPFDEAHFPDKAVRDWLQANKAKYSNSALGHPDNIVQERDGVLMVNAGAVTSWPTAYDYITQIEDMSCARYFINLGSISLGATSYNSSSWKKLKKINVSGLQNFTSMQVGITADAAGTSHYFDQLEEFIAENCPKLTTVSLNGCRNLSVVSFTGSQNVTGINLNLNGLKINSKGDSIVNHKLRSLDFAGFPKMRSVSKFSNNKGLRVARMSHTTKYLQPTDYPPQFHFNNTAVEEYDITQLGYDNYGKVYSFAIQFSKAPLHKLITRDEGLDYKITLYASDGQLPALDFPTEAYFESSTQTHTTRGTHSYRVQGDAEHGYYMNLDLKKGSIATTSTSNCSHADGKLHMHEGQKTGKYTFNSGASCATLAKGHNTWTVNLTAVEAPGLYLVAFDKENNVVSEEMLTYLGGDDYKLEYEGDLVGKFRFKVVHPDGTSYYLGPVRHDLVSPATALDLDGNPLFDISKMSVKDYNEFEHVANVLQPMRTAMAYQNGTGYYNGVYTEVLDDGRVKEDYILDKDSPYYFSTHEYEPGELMTTIHNPQFEVRYNGTHNTGHFYAYGNKGSVTGVNDIVADSADHDAPVMWFNLQGIRVSGDNLAPGIYIKVQGSDRRKILVK